MEKRKFYTLLLLCLMSVNAVWAQYAFTVFDANTGTLTYYYDTYANMQKMGGEEYDSSKDRFKNYAQNVKKAVIDASMKDAPFKNLNKMFFGGPGNELSNMTEIIGLENLNTQRVIDMTEMFYGCKSLKSLDLSKLNTENVESMNGMFELCASLKTLDLSKFSTSNVKDMSFMFDGCKALESVDLSSFNTQNVTDMNSMFYDCENLTVLNIAHFDMQSVTIVSSMFGGCKKLKTIYCNDDWTTIGMDADETFEECFSLVGGNGTRFDPDHTYLDYARPDKSGAPGYFTEVAPVPTDDRTVITECAFEGFDVSSLYAGLEWNDDAFEEIFNKIQKEDAYAPYHLEDPFDLFKDEISEETKVPSDQGIILEEGVYLFYVRISIDEDYATQFRFPTSEEGDLTVTMDGKAWTVDDVFVEEDESVAFIISPLFQVGKPAAPTKPEIYAVFDDAAKTMTLYYDKKRYDRNGVLEWMYDEELERNAAVETVILDASMKDARPVSTSEWFGGFISLTEIQHLDYLNTEDVTDMYRMFGACWELTSIDLSRFNTEKVEVMFSMFADCESLTNLDVSHFKTGNVTDMDYMFSGLKIKTLDLSKFDTKNVTSMRAMFGGCSELTELNLLSFDMNKVEYTSSMFADCSKLKTIKCDADLTHIDDANSEKMFKKCTSLVGGLGTVYDANHVDAEYAHPDEDGKPGYFTSSKQGLWNVQGNKVQSTKVIEDGVLYIMNKGTKYNVQGAEVR